MTATTTKVTTTQVAFAHILKYNNNKLCYVFTISIFLSFFMVQSSL